MQVAITGIGTAPVNFAEYNSYNVLRTYTALLIPLKNVGLADALIAASAEIYGLTLATLNKKHYPMLKTVHIPYRKPRKNLN